MGEWMWLYINMQLQLTIARECCIRVMNITCHHNYLFPRFSIEGCYTDVEVVLSFNYSCQGVVVAVVWCGNLSLCSILHGVCDDITQYVSVGLSRWYPAQLHPIFKYSSYSDMSWRRSTYIHKAHIIL